MVAFVSRRPVVAVTGGTGFVGKHLLRIAAREGYRLRALTRRSQPPMRGVTWVEGALDDQASLDALCQGTSVIVHIAGLINGSRAAFDAINRGGTQAIVDAATTAGANRFIHISSLAAREPELSSYGWSKLLSEEVVKASSLDWTIIRPPAIYGPADRETLELFRMARRGFVALPPKGHFSIIHVEDLCELVLAAIGAPESVGQTYEPDDGRGGGWEHRHFARTLGHAFGRRALPLSTPRFVMNAASRVEALLKGDKAKLTADRVRYFCHPDWVATADRRPPQSLWQPRIDTVAGLKQTADWYLEHGWLG